MRGLALPSELPALFTRILKLVVPHCGPPSPWVIVCLRLYISLILHHKLYHVYLNRKQPPPASTSRGVSTRMTIAPPPRPDDGVGVKVGLVVVGLVVRVVVVNVVGEAVEGVGGVVVVEVVKCVIVTIFAKLFIASVCVVVELLPWLDPNSLIICLAITCNGHC